MLNLVFCEYQQTEAYLHAALNAALLFLVTEAY